MREMILRVLLCIGTVLSFPTLEPHLPQTIDCPNSDIHVFVNQSAVDRKEYTFVDWNAANLQDCIEKCFGNHFCYSIRFDSSLDHNCALYYFAAYNCSNQALTKASTIDYKGGSITLDCIRCPGRGDFVTAPPFSSIGEQTIVSETAVLARGKNIKGTATEITHNSEHEGKPHGEVESNHPTDETKNGEGNGKEGEKGEIEGSGETPGMESGAVNTPTEEEPSASTETTLTGSNPTGTESEVGSDGSTAVPSAESTDATTTAPEEGETGSSIAPGSEAGTGTGSVEGSIPAPGTESGTESGATSEPTEEATGSTETGSTPSGTEESSTVEGSGEEEVASSPVTGESNGETESIEESSGEGAPTATGSTSAAPGVAPPEETLEGSGVEGSGTSPEISLQEEEEAVKVDVETTTVWNGHTEQPRRCEGNLRFVPSSTVDLDTVQLLINSTKANSPAECAKICYEHNCGFAYYEPSTFVCQFMANTEELVDSSTCPSDHKDSKYQAEFRTDVASTLTCAVCAKDSEVDNSKPALQPVSSPRRGSYPACIISFQAVTNGDHSSFPFYKSVQVKGLNECARHCFIGECSQSVYNPKTKECRLGSNPKDTCNNLPLIQKVAPPSEEVLLQCFRCIPEDLIGVKGTVSETTGYREPPTAAESIDEASSNQQKEKEQSDVSPPSIPPATTEETITQAATTQSATEETTTIAGSGDEVDLEEPLPEGVTEKPEEEETTSVSENTTTEEEMTTIGGEEVEIEEASGQEEETTTSAGESVTSSESSTTGETEAAEGENGEETTTTMEVEGSGEKEEKEGASTLTPESEANQDYGGSTPSGAAEQEEGVTEATTEETTTGGTEEETTVEGGEEGETSTVTGGEEEGTTAAGEGTTTAGGEGGEGTTAATEEGTSTVAGEETSSLSPEEAATSEGPGEMSKAIEANDQPLVLASEDLDFGKSCVIKFQSAPFSSRPSTMTAPFEKAFPVDSIELCATRCFQDGCTSAKYEPESKTCHLAYEDKPVCDRSELQLRMKEVTGEMWIHCVNCYPEKSVVKDVLGGSLNKTSEEKEGGEKSMLDKMVGAVSDVVHSVAETVTGENKDNALHHGCIVNFQTSPSTEIAEAVEYLPPFKTRYAHRCATKCFQEGCAAATFHPSTNECSLGYGRFVKCSNSPLVTTALDIKEKVTIHCLSCIHHKTGDGGVDLVVLSPDDERIHLSQSQDLPAEEAEGSGTIHAPVSPSGTAAEGAEATTASATVPTSTIYGAEEGTTVTGTEKTTTVAGEGSEIETTVAEGEGSSTAESSTESTVSEEGSSTTESSTEGTVSGEGSSTSSPLEGSGEVNGGSLGEEGSGAFDHPGTGKISEIPIETEEDRVKLPAGVEEGEVSGKVEVNGEKKGKFKPQIPTGFSIDSGLGRVQVDGKMSDEGTEGKTSEMGEKGSATGVTGEGETPSEKKDEEGESSTTSPSESSTSAAEGTESSTGLTTGEEEGETTTSSSTDESSTVTSSESSTANGETSTVGEEETSPTVTETSTAGEEEGESTTSSTDESSSTTMSSESSTAGGETSTAGEEETSSTVGHGTIHPAKEFETTPLHPVGEEVEVGSAESTTVKESEEGVSSSSTDSGATTSAAEDTTIEEEEEGPAFVQETPSEDEEKEEGLAIGNEDLKHREGLLEKALTTGAPTIKPTVEGEPKTGTAVSAEKPVAAEVIDAEMTTVSSGDVEETAASKSTVAPIGSESTTGSTPPATTAASSDSSTVEGTEEAAAWTDQPTGELDAAAAQDAETTVAASTESTVASTEGGETTVASEESTVASEATTSGVNDETASTTASDLVHREGIVEKALANAHPELTTKEGGMGESSTPTVTESPDESSSSTVEPTIESTVASSTQSEISSTEGEESTTAPEGTVSEGEGESTVVPIEGMGASIDEKTKEEPKGIDEEMAQKGEVKENGEKGASAASLDAGSSSLAPSDSTIAVPSPADLAKIQHHEKGGAEFGQTGQKGTEEKEVEEEIAHRDDVKGSGASGSSTLAPSDASGSTSEVPTTTVPSPADLAKLQHHEIGGAEFGQTGQKETEEKGVDEETVHKGEVKGSGSMGAVPILEGSSTTIPSDTDGSAAASGELTTSSSIDGGAGGMAREEMAESTTSGAEETTSESSTGTSDESSTISSPSDSTEESSTSSLEGVESTTMTTSESPETSINNEEIIQKALATANLKEGISTTAVPSPADLAKSQHHETGGAEFGQTGQKGTGESLDGGIDRALSAIGEETKATTEPPVQAVKDLLDALASGDFDRALLGKKTNGTEAEKILKGKTQITDVATPINQKHECSTGKLSFATFELVDLTTKFEADAVAFSLPHCARICYEVGCTMAAYSRFPRPLCLMHFEKDEKESHRCNGETNRTSHWEYSSLQQVVAIDCILCEGQTFFEHDHNVDITTLHAIDDSIVTVPSPQGISKNCDGGRLEFQFVPAGSLPRLNVTNDVPARTPADCARKCHEMKGCTTAGFIPTPSAEIANGVCLLTSDDEVCISRDDAVPQHASVTAFVISCIRCTRCSYTLSHMTLSSSTAKFQHISTVKTIGECAEVCDDKKCNFAQYDATTNTCALSMEASHENGCRKVEPSLSVKGSYPVRLECVQCRE